MGTTAIYARISRDDFGDGLGVRRQEDDCRGLAARRGLTVGPVFVDNDVSAFSGRMRPAYQGLLEAIRARQVDHVLAWAPERLHRSPRELEDFLELIERHGVQVETVKAGAWDVSTSHGRLVARMLGAVSRAESERTGERVSRAHQQAKANGRWRGPIPYGMKAGIDAGLPEIDEPQAAVVKTIADRLLRGDALTRIAADLNRDGVMPRRGKAWTHTGVQRLLNSPALGGLVMVDGELRDAAFDGVLDPTTWRSIQSAIASRPRGEKRRPREKLTLLGGILVCAEHGHVCVGSSATHGAVYTASKPGACHLVVKRDPCDELVTTTIIARLKRPDAHRLFEDENDGGVNEAWRAELQQRRDDIAGLLGEGLLSANAARRELEAIAQQLHEITPQTSVQVLSREQLRSPDEVWDSLTQPQRRQIVRILFERIAVRRTGYRNGPRFDPRRIEVVWRGEKNGS